MIDIPFIVLERYRITIQHYLDGREIEPPIGVEYCFNAGEIPRSIIVNKMMKKMKELMLEEASRAEPPKVVHCKDCVMHTDEEPGMVYCPHIVGWWCDDDWFCKSGERRKADET